MARFSPRFAIQPNNRNDGPLNFGPAFLDSHFEMGVRDEARILGPVLTVFFYEKSVRRV